MNKFYLLALAILAAGLTSMMRIEKYPQKTARPQKTAMNEPSFLQGTITIKVKEGMGTFGRQTGKVSFNLPTLDELVDRYEINLLEHRFKFNPQKLKAGMPDLSRIYRIEFPERYSVHAVAKAFEKNPFIAYAEPVPVIRVCDVPDDELYDQCQHLPQISADSAWDIHHGEDGEEIVIGIVDSGTDWLHPDLTENTWQNLGEDADNDGATLVFNGLVWERDPDDLNGIDDDGNGYIDDVIGWDFHEQATTGDGSNPDPLWGQGPYWTHGTRCTGIAAGRTNNGIGISSISWNVKYMPIQTSNGGNYFVYPYDGLIYAAENGADIISNSWSSENPSQAGEEAVRYAQLLGSIIVAAAGNYETDHQRYPASYPGVISVASVETDDTKAYYSSFGLVVDISAPGGGLQDMILSTVPNNQYDLKAGTSYATPLVAGCLGLLKSYHPDWTNDQLMIQLLGTADDINALNPDYQYLLGTGRVNAYHMLFDENVTMKQEFKLELVDADQADENANNIIEPGEEVVMNFEFRNYVPFLSEDSVTVLLQCDDPEIEIIDGTATVNIPPEGNFTIENQFLIEVAEVAHSHFVDFTLHFQSGTPVVIGQDMSYPLLIAPSGIFVYEHEYNGRDYSGAFIRSFLHRLGYEVIYANVFPATLNGFDAAFTSHGNRGADWSHGEQITEEQSYIYQEYLEHGGNLYVEKEHLFYTLASSGYSNYQDMKQLFGVNSHLAPGSQNKIDSLMGNTDTPFDGITFTESKQINNWKIEKPTPIDSLEGVSIPFQEYGYGNVSIMNDGISTYGHKTFYFTYALAELIDNSVTNSRYNVLKKILEFFGYELPEGYLLSNFISDKTYGPAPLTIQFSDISLTDSSFPANAWKWDFNSDGVIDSELQNPEWTFTEGYSHDITLIVSNGMNSDTITKEGYIQIVSGCLVFEGIQGAPCYSGTFINDFLSDYDYPVTYTTSLPVSLTGYDAVFLSFGNFGLEYTEMTDDMATTVIQYLETGGYVYLEGADALGFDQQGNFTLHNLFGLASVVDGDENEIDSLAGLPGAITEGMAFTSSAQQANLYIDKFVPFALNDMAFTESDYGCVGVQYPGPDGQRTFCFSYCLAELTDGEYPCTREELLSCICNFFDIVITGVDEREQNRVAALEVFPNPVKSQANINYPLNQVCDVTINLYNMNGVRLKSITKKQQPEGSFRQKLDMRDLPVGIYLCTLKTSDPAHAVQTKKLIKL